MNNKTAFAHSAGTAIDWSASVNGYCAALLPDGLARLATSLGLTAESLGRLSVGWSAAHRAFTFPMSDANGTFVGIRLRRPNGFKFAVKGSRQGLFVPVDLAGTSLDGRQLFIAEGPTDCGALLDLGLIAVGRPSCSGGVALLTQLVGRTQPTEVVVVADRDRPGQLGAAHLADVLAAYARTVRILIPPAKDAREWLRLGATTLDVLVALNGALAHKLRITIRDLGAIA